MSQISRIGDMRTSTQINKVVGISVCRDHAIFGPRGRIIRFAIEDFKLVRVGSEQFVSFGSVYLTSNKRLFAIDNFFHLRRDLF